MADLEVTSPLAETVKLISADGFEFVIDRKCAMASGTIKNMLSSPGAFPLWELERERDRSLRLGWLGQFTESMQNEITFRDIKWVL